MSKVIDRISDWLIERFWKEWPLICQNWLSFSIAVLLLSVFAAWGIWEYGYKRHLSQIEETYTKELKEQEKHYQKIIEMKQAAIDLQGRRLTVPQANDAIQVAPSSPCLRPDQRVFLIEKLRERVTNRLITIISPKETKTEAGRCGEGFVELFRASGWNVKKEPDERQGATPVKVWFQPDDPVALFLLIQLQGAGIEVERHEAGVSDEIKFIIGRWQ